MAKSYKKPAKGIKQYCAYYRVSTDKQGRSGLGLEAQRAAVQRHINGGAVIAKEFQDVESGRKERPGLEAAVAYCKEHGACLVASKLDRLARSVWIFERIKREGIDFEIVGLPKTPFVLAILAAVAEWEAKAISERTKAALAIKKAKGKKLGYHRREVAAGVKRYWRQRKKELAAARKAKPAPPKQPSKRELADKKIAPLLRAMRKTGLSYAACAARLNESGVKGRSGGQWSAPQVFKVVRRCGIA